MSTPLQAIYEAKDHPPTVHVIDDDVSLRGALELLLSMISVNVRTYVSVQEFLDANAHDGLGCIVLDVRLPGLSGLEFQTRSQGLGIRLPIVLITGHGDVLMAVRAMKAGAVDFLPKPFRDQDMIDAVMAAIERDWQRRAADRAAADFRARFENLSSRERQVMTLVTAGKMNKQVAFELGLSEITVKTYRGAVMQKMAARSFADLVRMAEALETHGCCASVPDYFRTSTDPSRATSLLTTFNNP
jgi:FixJ family two-component response regulator